MAAAGRHYWLDKNIRAILLNMTTSPSRRCTATTKRGTRCRHRALLPDPESPIPDPQLCNIHAGRVHAHGDSDAARCTATTRRGTRCRNLAIAGSQERYGALLCAAHTGARWQLAPDGTRCTAIKKDGTRCRNRAMHPDPQSLVPGAQLCNIHGGRRQGRPPDDRRCTATNKDGTRCRHWAKRGTDPRRCTVHAGLAGFQPGNRLPVIHGFHSLPRLKHFRMLVGALPPLPGLGDSGPRLYQEVDAYLTEAIVATRVTLYVLVGLTREPTQIPRSQFYCYTHLIFRATSLLAGIMKERKKIRDHLATLDYWDDLVARIEATTGSDAL